MSAIPHTRNRIPGKIDSKAEVSWTPAVLPGVLSWFDSGMGLALSNNDPVGTWPSQISVTYDMAQATADNKPLYITGAVNGLPAIRFDGSNDFLNMPDPDMTTGNVFIVLSATTSLADRRLWCPSTTGTSPGGGLMFSNNNKFSAINASGNVIEMSDALSVDTWYVLSTVHAAFLISGYINGVACATTVSSTTAHTEIMGLGNRTFGSYGSYFKGDIASVIVVKGTVLSDADRELTEAYLMTRFGIAA